jgi:hypothetical protein
MRNQSQQQAKRRYIRKAMERTLYTTEIPMTATTDVGKTVVQNPPLLPLGMVAAGTTLMIEITSPERRIVRVAKCSTSLPVPIDTTKPTTPMGISRMAVCRGLSFNTSWAISTKLRGSSIISRRSPVQS